MMVMEETDKEQKSIQHTTLLIAMITNFIPPFAVTALNIAVPHIGTEFHASTTSLTWIVVSFLLVSSVLSLPVGRIADIYGRRPVLKAGILLICISTFLNIFSPNMTVFLAFRVLQGISAAMIFSTNVALLVDVFPASKRGSVLGISVAAVYTGSACGPVIGGLITHAFGWRGVFAAISLLALIAFILAMIRSPKETKPGLGQKLNISSIVFYIVSLGTFLYGLVTLSQHILSYIIIAAGCVLLVFFVKHEGRTEVPVFDVRLFRGNLTLVLSIMATLFNYAAVFAVSYLFSIYLQLARGFNADISGFILISQPVVQIALSLIAGRLSDKKTPSAIASTGMACCAGALFMFTFVGVHTPIPYIIAGLMLTGVGIGLFASPNTNVILSSVSSKDYSVASSMISTARTVGQVIGMAILTIIINAVIGNVSIEKVAAGAIVQDMHISFSIFAVICVVGIMFSLGRRRKAVGSEQ